jgi:hypothetical protein
MDIGEITSLRLYNQGISTQRFNTPLEAVSHLGAVQAQDYKASLWGIGLRCREGITRSDIEDAILARKIVRTWSMRHTLHFTAGPDVKWMLGLYGEEKIPAYQRRNGLNDKILEEGLELISNAFKKKEQLTNKEMHKTLENTKIPEMKKAEVRAHIIRRAGREGIICFGSHNGKTPTFALLDEWVSKPLDISYEEAVEKQVLCYFTSHGPATIQDFVWWSGLRVADARLGIERAGSKLNEETINGKKYFMSMARNDTKLEGTYLLPAFDEYLVSYRDRSAMLAHPQTQKTLKSGKVFFVTSNGIFSPVVVIDGQVLGAWKMVLDKNKGVITLNPFVKLTAEQKKSINEAAQRYGRFLQTEIMVK